MANFVHSVCRRIKKFFHWSTREKSSDNDTVEPASGEKCQPVTGRGKSIVRQSSHSSLCSLSMMAILPITVAGVTMADYQEDYNHSVMTNDESVMSYDFNGNFNNETGTNIGSWVPAYDAKYWPYICVLVMLICAVPFVYHRRDIIRGAIARFCCRFRWNRLGTRQRARVQPVQIV